MNKAKDVLKKCLSGKKIKFDKSRNKWFGLGKDKEKDNYVTTTIGRQPTKEEYENSPYSVAMRLFGKHYLALTSEERKIVDEERNR